MSLSFDALHKLFAPLKNLFESNRDNPERLMSWRALLSDWDHYQRTFGVINYPNQYRLMAFMDSINNLNTLIQEYHECNQIVTLDGLNHHLFKLFIMSILIKDTLDYKTQLMLDNAITAYTKTLAQVYTQQQSTLRKKQKELDCYFIDKKSQQSLAVRYEEMVVKVQFLEKQLEITKKRNEIYHQLLGREHATAAFMTKTSKTETFDLQPFSEYLAECSQFVSASVSLPVRPSPAKGDTDKETPVLQPMQHSNQAYFQPYQLRAICTQLKKINGNMFDAYCPTLLDIFFDSIYIGDTFVTVNQLSKEINELEKAIYRYDEEPLFQAHPGPIYFIDSAAWDISGLIKITQTIKKLVDKCSNESVVSLLKQPEKTAMKDALQLLSIINVSLKTQQLSTQIGLMEKRIVEARKEHESFMQCKQAYDRVVGEVTALEKELNSYTTLDEKSKQSHDALRKATGLLNHPAKGMAPKAMLDEAARELGYPNIPAVTQATAYQLATPAAFFQRRQPKPLEQAPNSTALPTMGVIINA